MIDQINAEIADRMQLIALDAEAGLYLDFGMVSAPTINNTKIVAFLNGDIFYEELGVS